ncbi:MAG: ribonuclease D [Spongiibacteraceae bacterium]
MTNIKPLHVTSNSQLADIAAQLRDKPLLAIDTEFQRETTFYPIAGLIQLGDAQHQYLIDPLTIDDWSPLRELFVADKRCVLHACGEDLEVFARVVDTIPTSLFDTQVGAALAGLGFSLSYQALVRECLGIEVEKEQTRSDWLRRPLSAEQCHYAALDIAHLPVVFDLIAERLDKKNRMSWWESEGHAVLAMSRDTIAPEQYYLKLSGGWRLRGVQVAALQKLCTWREIEARKRDVPRGRILKDAQCLEIARVLPRSLAELSGAPELHPQQVRIEGEKILELIAQARALPAEEYPVAIDEPLRRELGDRLKQLRKLVEDRARELDMAPEILARKRDCEILLRTGMLPDSLLGWRRDIIGEPLLALLKTFFR